MITCSTCPLILIIKNLCNYIYGNWWALQLGFLSAPCRSGGRNNLHSGPPDRLQGFYGFYQPIHYLFPFTALVLWPYIFQCIISFPHLLFIWIGHFAKYFYPPKISHPGNQDIVSFNGEGDLFFRLSTSGEVQFKVSKRGSPQVKVPCWWPAKV